MNATLVSEIVEVECESRGRIGGIGGFGGFGGGVWLEERGVGVGGLGLLRPHVMLNLVLPATLHHGFGLNAIESHPLLDLSRVCHDLRPASVWLPLGKPHRPDCAWS